LSVDPELLNGVVSSEFECRRDCAERSRDERIRRGLSNWQQDEADEQGERRSSTDAVGHTGCTSFRE
jgi:hypothetical protein